MSSFFSPAVPAEIGSSSAQSCRLTSIDAESRLFFRLRAQLAWSNLRSMLLSARLRLSLVILLSAMFWGSLYGLFVEAFTFLDALHAEVISLLFNAFFSSLMIMLVFSTGILIYSGMYCSAEAKLLMTLPAREEAIFSHKFQEALWFSSWGFILLGSPMLVAYGVVRHSPWTYFAMLLPFMVSFVVIPATVGGICCMVLAGWMPRLRLHALSVGLAREHGINIAVLMPYVDRLNTFAFWYRQIWAESLGKDGQGTTPAVALGTVDQHSQVQLYLGGPADKLFTFLIQDTAGQGPVLRPGADGRGRCNGCHHRQGRPADARHPRGRGRRAHDRRADDALYPGDDFRRPSLEDRRFRPARRRGGQGSDPPVSIRTHIFHRAADVS